MVNLYNFGDFLTSLQNALGNTKFILFIAAASFLIKFYIIAKLLSNTFSNKRSHTSLILLITYIAGSMLADLAWVIKFAREIYLPFVDIRIQLFCIRIIWALNVIQYHSLALFIESLIKTEKLLGIRQKIYIFVTTAISVSFFVVAFTKLNVITSPNKEPVLKFLFNAQLFYNLYCLLLVSTIITLVRLRKAKIPKMLKKQLKIFLWVLIAPNLAAELSHFYPFDVFHNFLNNQFALVAISLILTTATVFYSIKKVMGLRFLNMKHPQPKQQFDFIQDFKNVLEQFSQVTSTRELEHITQNFLKTAFCIPTQKTHLYVRKLNSNQSKGKYKPTSCYNESIVETFINAHDQNCCIDRILKESKILVKDDIEFSNYYEEDKPLKRIVKFLNSINASIFIPICEKNKLIAYIIVESHVRVVQNGKKSEFYSNKEKDQITIFAKYLGNIINLLHNRNLKTLIRKEKELQEELYSKHQEINQYKESIRLFLKKNQDKKIGILFYKNRQFVFGNQIAKNLIPININSHEGHPITKALKKMSHQVLNYKAPQTSIVKDLSGNKLVLYGIPNIEKAEVIIAIHYPEISDILKDHINLLKDPTKWDYLLYLETTESGKLINKLIPGNGQTLLNFKIELLKIALSKKAILLDMAEQDLIPTVEILHHISLREKLHILNLKKPTKNFDTAIKLFGINPIFALEEKRAKPILQSLDGTGTLFIKNIHFLDLGTQKQLADFIRYGIYKPFKGEHTASSNVRIICSTNINLKIAVQDGKFSQSLFDEINKTSMVMPPLMTLPENELTNLTKGFTDQTIKTNEFKHIFQLTNIEEKKIVASKPSSIKELKEKVQKLLEKKSKQHKIYEETSIYQDHTHTDPEIIEAARLGKHALKNRQVMEMLWEKFKNQNKIATLLGVNRSSVNRRCKDYNLK